LLDDWVYVGKRTDREITSDLGFSTSSAFIGTAVMGKATGLPPCITSEHREPPMAIYRLLKNCAFGPEEIKVLTTAYEEEFESP
jgi:hypothetical protein